MNINVAMNIGSKNIVQNLINIKRRWKRCCKKQIVFLLTSAVVSLAIHAHPPSHPSMFHVQR